jgi:hypothetical protein
VKTNITAYQFSELNDSAMERRRSRFRRAERSITLIKPLPIEDVYPVLRIRDRKTAPSSLSHFLLDT